MKVAVTAGLIVGIVAVYYMLFYMDMQDQTKAGEVQQRNLIAERILGLPRG